MAERRSLVEGVKQTQPSKIEREFVYGGEGKGPATPEAVIVPVTAVTLNQARSPISTRIRADYAAALKRASLERQLANIEPNTISDILELALEPWLKANGHLL